MKKLLIVVAVLLFSIEASAGGFGFSLGTDGIGVGYNGRHSNFYVGVPYGGYYVAPSPYGYYPVYNPVVRRDFRQQGYIAPDGTFHAENTVEDRSASYYSPGRNEAVTQPQRTIRYAPNGSIDRTEWIGSDGLPHSTTIQRQTYQDGWGNTQTDTHVDLKSKGQTQVPIAEQTNIQRQPSQQSLNKPPTLMPKKQ